MKTCFLIQAGEKALKACLYTIGKRLVLDNSLFEMVTEFTKRDSLFEKIREQA